MVAHYLNFLQRKYLKRRAAAERMYCLGIESTAHTFGAAVVTGKGKILSNVRDLYTTESGGLIPAKLAIHHVDVCGRVVTDALQQADITPDQLDLISFSQSPGIGHALRIGCMAAKSLALQLRIPLVGVNHCIAHLEIGRLLCKAKDPVLLYASGANTQVIAYEGGKYRIFGETLDIGVGNFLDAFARELGLGFPGGPKLEQLAKDSKRFIPLPYAVKGMDVSFGGLLTNLKHKWRSEQHAKSDLAFSMQETAFAMLVEVAERAMAHTGKCELLLAGGVACNGRLQQMAAQMCRDRGAKCYVPERQFLVDNAAMIAWLGVLQHCAGGRSATLNPKNATIQPYVRTDEITVAWR